MTSIVKLGDVATVITKGTTPTTVGYQFVDSGIPFLRAEDVNGGFVSFADAEKRITPECHKAFARSQLQSGDLLITIAGSVGRVGIVPDGAGTANCNQAVSIVRLKPGLFDLQFLCYFLRTSDVQQRFRQQGTTATITNVSLEQIKNVGVPVLSLPEQRNIVDLLCRAEGILRLRREAEKKAAELIPALFIDMFGDPATNPKGWPMASVGNVLDAIDYGSSSKATSDGLGLPMIRMGNVTYEGNLNLADLKYVDLPATEAERYSLKVGDILFNRTNSKELVGKTGLWDVAHEAIVASYFIRLRVQREVVSPHYLWAFMNSAHMKRVIFDTARGAIGQSNINSKELKAFPLPVPPLSLQQQFALRCADVSGLTIQQSSATAKAKATFDALLAEAFSLT